MRYVPARITRLSVLSDNTVMEFAALQPFAHDARKHPHEALAGSVPFHAHPR